MMVLLLLVMIPVRVGLAVVVRAVLVLRMRLVRLESWAVRILGGVMAVGTREDGLRVRRELLLSTPARE